MAVLVQFPYDPVKIARIKSIPSAKWDQKRQGWLIPNQYREQAELLLADNPVAAPARPSQWRFATQPWPHQLAALEYAYDKPAVLFDMGMGTGKTRVALDVVNNRRHTKTLVVCPKSVIPVWVQQVQRHTDGELFICDLHSGSVKQNKEWAEESLFECLVQTPRRPWIGSINYESVWREPFASWALAQKWDCLICDEIHRAKSPGGKAARFLYRLGFQATQRLGLSGTPLPHSPLDAYGVYRVLEPSIFGTNFKKFQDTYCVMGGFGGYQCLAYKNQAEFRQKFDSIRFHVSRDVLDLPEAMHVDIPITLPGDARRLYKRLETDFYAEVESGAITVANALVSLLRLQEATSGYLKLDDGTLQELHTAKSQALSDLLSDLDPAEPVVVFARFRHDLQTICKVATATGRHYYELSGSYKELERWKGDDSGAVLGVQIGAGSEGIDLTKAHYCVLHSLPLSLAQYDQALARVHRPGQSRSVMYYHLLVSETVDVRIFKALQKRREVIDAIVNGKEDV